MTNFDTRISKLEATLTPAPPVVPTVRIVYAAVDGQPERVVISDANGRHEVPAGLQTSTEGAP